MEGLEIFYGGRHLVQELGTVASNVEHIIGVVSSSEMMKNAKATCQNLSCIETNEGGARDIPSDNAQLDEYVENVARQ